MSAPELTLDLSGYQCPLPVLKTRKALDPLPSGSRVCIIATDKAARIDMAHYCAISGHTLIEMREEGARLIFLIQKG